MVEGKADQDRASFNSIRLSACMMVKNEEEMLPRCLASIRNQVDEIVVVDTGSTDRTVEIAEGFGARVYHHPWQNDFSLHRNQSISYASGKWIFIIDADEEFIPSPRRSLRQELALAQRKGMDALVLRVENVMSKGAERICADSIRIFRNNGVSRYEGIVHNNLVGCAHACASLGTILHYGYDRGSETVLQKFERTATLLRRQIAENPENPLPHMYLACSHESLGNTRDAIEEALAAIDLVEDRGLTEAIYVRAYYVAVRALTQEKRLDEALAVCRKSEARFGGQVDLLASETLIHTLLKNWEGVLDAGARYREALERYRNRREEVSLVNVATFGDEWKICGWMGEAHLKRGNFPAADDHFRLSLKLSPNPESIYGHVGLSLFAAGQGDRARFYLEKARSLSGEKKNPRIAESLFRIALLEGDAALKEKTLEDMISLAEPSGAWSRWILSLADFATDQGDVRSALMLLAGIVAADEEHLQARLKLAHILVFHDMIEAAVTHCDGLLRILGLPRNRTLESMADLADLFRMIGDELESRNRKGEAAVSHDMADRLAGPAKRR